MHSLWYLVAVISSRVVCSSHLLHAHYYFSCANKHQMDVECSCTENGSSPDREKEEYLPPAKLPSLILGWIKIVDQTKQSYPTSTHHTHRGVRP